MDPADDIRGALPQPPPPQPGPRSAAIGAALERYDNTRRSTLSGSAGTERAREWWQRLFAPQYAALAGIAIVALVSLPRLETANRVARVTTSTVVSGTAARDDGAATVVAAQPAATAPPMAKTETAAAAAPVPATPASLAESLPPGTTRLSDASAPPAPSISLQSVETAADAAAVPPPPPPPAAPAPAQGMVAGVQAAAPEVASRFVNSATAESDADAGRIIVTAQRRRASAVPVSDDWPACTLEDPQQALARCRGQIDPGAAGPRGRAAALLADGLSLGWRGDLDGAVEKFDEAIDLTPRSALAHLNRALARQRRGEVANAAADFDLAVRYGHGDARSYYFRGRFKREQGDVRGATQDEQRASAANDRIGTPRD